MPLCLCLSARASSRVAKMFTDKFQTNHNHIMTFVPETSQGSSFHRYFSYFLLSVSWLHPF